MLARLGYSGIIFIPIVFFDFVVAFTESRSKKTLVFLFYLAGALFGISTWVGGGFVAGVYRYYWGFYPKVGPLHIFYLGFLLIMLFAGLYLLVEQRRKIALQPIRLNQVKYVFVSTVIYSLAGIDFLMNYGVEFYPLGLIFTNVHAGLVAYAIARYRLMDINIIVKRGLIYALLLLLLLVPSYLLVIGGQILAFGRIHYAFSLFTLGLFIVVGFFFPRLHFRTQEAFERVLFKKRYDYRETLLRWSRDLISVVDIESLSTMLVETVVKALGVERASLFLLDENKGSFGLKASLGLEENTKDVVLSRDDALVLGLTRRSEALVKEELEMSRDGRDSKDAARAMAQLEAEVSLPLLSKGKLIGILNLGHKDSREMYGDEDLEILSTLANQASIAIENARLYENLKQSQSIIRRADRLSSLGQLTAGLAHEIRNPLVAIRTFTQLLPERHNDEEFRNNFQSLALKEVDRICGLVTDLLSFARPSAPNIAAEDVNEIVESIARILETEAKEKGIQIYRRLATNLPKIFIDKEQIKQVCMNVILNALQSIEKEGVVQVSTRLFARDGSEQFVQIEVRDTGTGIPEKDLENIFNPFFTTKKGGSGLGLSITHQIVQEHGGFIVVQSKVGQGTTFFINLPLKPPAQPLKLRPKEDEKSSGR